MDQLKQVPGLWLCELQKKPFINDQQNRFGVFLQDGLKVPGVPRRLQVKEQIRKADILYCVILLAGFHTEGTGHVGFIASGCAGDEDVAALCDVFAVRHPLDQGFIELPSGMVIDCRDRSIRLLEIRLTNQAF